MPVRAIAKDVLDSIPAILSPSSWSARAISSPTPPHWRPAINQGEKYNPLFIYGGVGLGQDPSGHLRSDIIPKPAGEHPRQGAVRARGEIFMNELITSLRRDGWESSRRNAGSVDALILDDVQFLAGRERTQEEFFHTFNSLHADRHQIVLTSERLHAIFPGLKIA